MARLRLPVSFSDSKTASSTSSSRPAKPEYSWRIRSIGSSKPSGLISEVVAIAPALTIGLSGMPVPGCRVIELKASPEGSTSTCLRTSDSPIASIARA